MKRSRSYIATPPGATIKEQLTDRGMSQKEFAARMDMSEKHISRLINGEVMLTAEVAVRLEMVLGLPAHFWNNLESIYREKLQKIQEENAIEFFYIPFVCDKRNTGIKISDEILKDFL